jgi:hypothetical protein
MKLKFISIFASFGSSINDYWSSKTVAIFKKKY